MYGRDESTGVLDRRCLLKEGSSHLFAVTRIGGKTSSLSSPTLLSCSRAYNDGAMVFMLEMVDAFIGLLGFQWY